MPKGKVYLVGAGPGDPGLLTIRGKNCLEQADVVLYDHLANPVLLDYAPPHAERIYVGRCGRGAYRPQEEIHRLLIQKVQEGKQVVRLKGGDPFVFGRGGGRSRDDGWISLVFEQMLERAVFDGKPSFWLNDQIYPSKCCVAIWTPECENFEKANLMPSCSRPQG